MYVKQRGLRNNNSTIQSIGLRTTSRDTDITEVINEDYININ